jgi:hypothetical protein
MLLDVCVVFVLECWANLENGLNFKNWLNFEICKNLENGLNNERNSAGQKWDEF